MNEETRRIAEKFLAAPAVSDQGKDLACAYLALQAELRACEKQCERLRLRVSLLEAHTTGLGTAGALSVEVETEQELAE